MPDPILIKTDSEAWMERGLCVGKNPDMWEPGDHGVRPHPGSDMDRLTERGRMNVAALHLCNACPVREECLAYAVETKQAFLIWGGLYPNEREAML